MRPGRPTSITDQFSTVTDTVTSTPPEPRAAPLSEGPAPDRPARPARPQNEFTRSRDADKLHNVVQNGRAARTVASHSLDAQDCQALLSMLGLQPTDGMSQRPAATW